MQHGQPVCRCEVLLDRGALGGLERPFGDGEPLVENTHRLRQAVRSIRAFLQTGSNEAAPAPAGEPVLTTSETA